MRCYIFDLDGTLCNIEHRLHYIINPAGPQGAPGAMVSPPPVDPLREVVVGLKPAAPWKKDWDGFNAACVGDKPIEPMIELADHLGCHTPLLFVSGRSDAVRFQTEEWLRLNLCAARRRRGLNLYMRPDGDHRPDHELKSMILDVILAAGWQPIMCFDDRKQVVDMWRARGLICAQVAKGDF